MLGPGRAVTWCSAGNLHLWPLNSKGLLVFLAFFLSYQVPFPSYMPATQTEIVLKNLKMDRYNRAWKCNHEGKWTQCVTNKEVLWSREVKYQQNVKWDAKDEGEGTIHNKSQSTSRNIFSCFLGSISPKIIIAVTTGLPQTCLLPLPNKQPSWSQNFFWITAERRTSF